MGPRMIGNLHQSPYGDPLTSMETREKLPYDLHSPHDVGTFDPGLGVEYVEP